MSEHKTKLFSYWRARFTPEPYAKTMQQLLKAAFDNTTVEDRLYATDNAESYYTFINYKTERQSCFCASFFGYEKGRIGQVIKESFKKDQIDSKALPAPKADDGTDQQFLDGKLYLVCKGDHIILAQDMHLKGRHLERYLEAKIRERISTFPKEQVFQLERSIPQATKRKLKGVKKINLSAPLGYKTQASDTNESKTITVPDGARWEAVKSFVKEKLDLKEFTTDGFIDPRDIEITLSLNWKRKRGEKVSDQIDTLANALRHVEDEIDFELETNSGKLKKGELRLNHATNILHVDDMPEPGDIFDKMIDWYSLLVDSKDI